MGLGRKLEVGFVVVAADGDAVLSSFGASSLSFGNQPAVVTAVVNEVNAQGGILGERVVPVVFQVKTTSADSFATQAQAACASFFDDHHVRLVVASSLYQEPALLECTSRHRVALINGGGLDLMNAQQHRQFPLALVPAGIDLDRLQGAYVDSLAGQGFFSGWDTALASAASANPVKIGVLYGDASGQSDVVRNSLVPALTRHRLPVAATFQGHSPTSVADTARTAQDMQSAVLRFRQAGVTHIVAVDPVGTFVAFFANAANAQGYYPRLGLSSAQEPSSQQSLSQPKSLWGAMGLGWLPYWDVDADNDPGPSKAARRCLTTLQKNGIATSSRSADAIALGICEGLYLPVAAWSAGGSLTTDGLLTGLRRLGTSYVSTQAFRVDLARPSGAQAVAGRPLAYKQSCSCFQYAGPLATIS